MIAVLLTLTPQHSVSRLYILLPFPCRSIHNPASAAPFFDFLFLDQYCQAAHGAISIDTHLHWCGVWEHVYNSWMSMSRTQV